MDLAAFLLARYDEREAIERAEKDEDRTHYGECFIVYNEYGNCTCDASFDLLADIEAKRRLIGDEELWLKGAMDDVLRILARPYADHADYDPAWRDWRD